MTKPPPKHTSFGNYQRADFFEARCKKLEAALNEVMPRYCELFEAAGLGDSSVSVAVTIANEALK